jgi:hypothetical protein
VNVPLGCGVVYKLYTAGTETVLHSFCKKCADGTLPSSPVVRDKGGNIYGTIESEGQVGYGVVSKIDTGGAKRCCTGGSPFLIFVTREAWRVIRILRKAPRA